ncbi:olfactory receptor 6-like [Austrofundulus limnaeus]|uniref:Olfactory receptor 6-like n=1 Tax=Austrofundulus limnaeus TaxID=52670 RepID=A0A2I4AST3_AUSLI|nr:PREDICTED: olfactory receptor 6-like [Austrofundulus limnaeus]
MRPIARYWWNDGSIGVYTCLFQRHMIHCFGSLNSLILLTMAVDRYLAICFPLRYSMLMTIPTMSVLTVLCWVTAHIFPGSGSSYMTQMSFCGPNQILQAFCHTGSLVALVCGDSSYVYSASYTSAMIILYVTLGFLIFSYFCIVVTVLQMGKKKTFSTCVTQGFIISINYLPHFFVYTAPYIPNFQMIMTGGWSRFFSTAFPPIDKPICLLFQNHRDPRNFQTVDSET